ncbi:MAG: type II secretion system protein [Candidatus Muiribacteriota bacterium]
MNGFNSKKGYSLNEIVVAIVILGLATTPLFMVTMQSNKNLQENVLYLDALMAATTVMAQAKQQSFISLYNNSEIKIDRENNMGFQLSGDIFEKTLSQIKLKFETIDKNFYYITLQMSYRNNVGREVSINMESGAFASVY